MELIDKAEAADVKAGELLTSLEQKKEEYQTYRDTLSLSSKKATSEEQKQLSALEKEVTDLQAAYDAAKADVDKLNEAAQAAIQEYLENFSERVDEFSKEYKALQP